MDTPPSTSIAVPVTNEEASDARYSAACDLLRHRQPLQRVQIGHLRQRLRGIAHLPAHRRIGAARQQRVHPNAAPAELHRQRLRQADQPRLAGRIGRRAGKRRGVADEGGVKITEPAPRASMAGI